MGLGQVNDTEVDGFSLDSGDMFVSWSQHYFALAVVISLKMQMMMMMMMMMMMKVVPRCWLVVAI